MEEDFGQLLSFCIDPQLPASKGIHKRMLRAYDPQYAKNEKDRKIRERKRLSLLNRIIEGEDIPDRGIYPGLGERWNRTRGEQTALPIPKRYFERLGVKIVRGISYIEDRIAIDEKYEIETYVVNKDGAQPFEEALARFGYSLSRGPGIVVNRAVTQDDGISGIYKVTVWGELVIYLSVLPSPPAE